MRTDGAGYSHTFLQHLVDEELEYSIGYAVTDEARDAITRLAGGLLSRSAERYCLA